MGVLKNLLPLAEGFLTKARRCRTRQRQGYMSTNRTGKDKSGSHECTHKNKINVTKTTSLVKVRHSLSKKIAEQKSLRKTTVRDVA